MKTISEAEVEIKKAIKEKGKIIWQTNPQMIEIYTDVVDTFGRQRSGGKRKSLIDALARNSGFFEGTLDGHSGACCYASENCKNPSDRKPYVAVCLYPSGPKNMALGAYAHEAVHFLNRWGPKKERIIKRDVPLATVFEAFFDLIENPEQLKEFGNLQRFVTSHLQSANTCINPFVYTLDFKPHMPHKTKKDVTYEGAEAGIIGINAFLLSQKSGKQAGLDYIRNLVEEADAVLRELKINPWAVEDYHNRRDSGGFRNGQI